MADARELQARVENRPADTNSLNRLHRSAVAAAETIDELVWVIDPTGDTVESFATFASEFAASYLRANRIASDLCFPPNLPKMPLSPSARHNLFFALKEALHNVVRHAAATKVTMALSVSEHSLEMRIIDDERGFLLPHEVNSRNGSPSTPPRTKGGHGLANIHTRLLETMPACSSRQRTLGVNRSHGALTLSIFF